MAKKVQQEVAAKKKIQPKKAAPAAKKAEAESAKKRAVKPVYLLRGMKDILPKDELYWQAVHASARNVARSFNFQYINIPVLEEAALFNRSIGKGTDIIDKEMYVFEDRDTTKVALRPEFTAGVTRAYIQHGMHTYPQPVKLWTTGGLFRHDRPQAGRYREHHQIGFEVYGDEKPVTDAEVIIAAHTLLSELGLSVTVRINSIGTPEDRTRYTLELLNYLRSKRGYLPDEIKKRMNKNPLRVLDSKLEEMKTVIEEAPQILDWVSDASKQRFMQVLEYLDEVGVPYELSPTLVRGLDYYSHTLFELYATENGEHETQQSALGGGGRYDGLAEQIGGPPTPAMGFGIGVERVMLELKRTKTAVPRLSMARIFLAQLGEQASRRGLKILMELRKEGIEVMHNFGKSGLKQQLELANKHGLALALIVGQKEVVDGTAIVRDMDSGIQEIVDQKQLVKYLRKKLDQLPALSPTVVPGTDESVAPAPYVPEPKNMAAAADDDEEDPEAPAPSASDTDEDEA